VLKVVLKKGVFLPARALSGTNGEGGGPRVILSARSFLLSFLMMRFHCVRVDCPLSSLMKTNRCDVFADNQGCFPLQLMPG